MLRATLMVLLTTALGAGMTGCGDDTKPVTTAELEGTSYVSTSVTGRELVDGTELSLNFEGGRLAASAGCNTIGGTYTLDDGKLTQGEAIRTQMSCGAETDAQEQWLAELLSEGATVTLLDYTLTLTTADEKLVFKKQTKPTGPPPIVGTLWTLTSTMERGGAASSVPAGVRPPTLQIGEDGNAAIYTGCNRGNGPAKVADGFVTFGPLGMTRMACQGAAGELEKKVLEVLDGKAAAGFSGEGDLSLAKDGNSLLFRAG